MKIWFINLAASAYHYYQEAAHDKSKQAHQHAIPNQFNLKFSFFSSLFASIQRQWIASEHVSRILIPNHNHFTSLISWMCVRNVSRSLSLTARHVIAI